WSLMIEQARRDSYKEVSPEDSERLFYQRSVPKRLIIMLGGPLMNLLLAVILLTVVVSGFGTMQAIPTAAVVSKCVLPADAPDTQACRSTDPAAPAAAAGLRPGDVIKKLNGAEVTSWDQVRTGIRDNGGKQIDLQVQRAGKLLDIKVTPL